MSSVLDKLETALNFASTMKWNGKHQAVKLIHEIYQNGVKPTKKAMAQIEKQIEQLTDPTHEFFPNLVNWFIKPLAKVIFARGGKRFFIVPLPFSLLLQEVYYLKVMPSNKLSLL